MPLKNKKRVQRKAKPRVFLRQGQFHVYMLECADGSFYTGYTNDLKKRVALHNKGGGSKYVKTRLPAELIYFKPYKYFKLAILEERRVKKLSRVLKEKMVHAFRKSKIKIKKILVKGG